MATITLYPQDWKEARRLQALELKHKGWPQHKIAEALSVSKAAVSQWMKAVRKHGRMALRAHPHPGPSPKLLETRLQLVPELLWHGAEAYGFRGAVWTCARVATVIEQEFGVLYSRSHVSRLLKHLAWTPQTPLVRATQRDEALIACWRMDVWPELKKEPGEKVVALYS